MLAVNHYVAVDVVAVVVEKSYYKLLGKALGKFEVNQKCYDMLKVNIVAFVIVVAIVFSCF